MYVPAITIGGKIGVTCTGAFMPLGSRIPRMNLHSRTRVRNLPVMNSIPFLRLPLEQSGPSRRLLLRRNRQSRIGDLVPLTC